MRQSVSVLADIYVAFNQQQLVVKRGGVPCYRSLIPMCGRWYPHSEITSLYQGR